YLSNGEILITDSLNQLCIYDPSTNIWITTGDIFNLASGTACLLNDWKLLTTGGLDFNNTVLNRAQLFY
ncbi:unnamed protein product, partial [Adineta ricciae]